VSAERLNILLVEDNPGDARLFKEALNEAYAQNYTLLHCTSLAQALDRLPTAQPDVIVVDLGLPDAFGIDVVQRTRMGAPAVPVVVLSNRAVFPWRSVASTLGREAVASTFPSAPRNCAVNWAESS